jgi:peptidoglycan/LPS O-acetylase OafA/YrhL
VTGSTSTRADARCADAASIVATNGYIPALDGLRAVSVLAVLLFHLRIGYPGGFLGVDIFFVLSGYLITTILLRDFQQHGRIRFGYFYMRRVRRLVPALVGTLFLTWMVWSLLPKAGPFVPAATASLFYYANWYMCLNGSASMGALAHTWSLSVEEQFYIVWPFLMVVLLMVCRDPKRQGRIVFTLVALLAIARAALYCLDSMLGTYFSTLARADAILIGSGCALLTSGGSGAGEFWAGRRGTLIAWACGITIVILSAFLTIESDFLFMGGLSFIALYAAAVMVHLAQSRSGLMTRLMANRFAVAIGKRSYGIYLYHFPVFIACGAWASSNAWWNTAGLPIVKVTAALLIAWLSYRFLEQPLLAKSTPRRLAETPQPVPVLVRSAP